MSSVSPDTMSVCLSSRRYSGVISAVDSMSSPDLMVFSNSAAVGMTSFSDNRRWVESGLFPGPWRGRAAVAIAQQAEHQIVDLGVAGSSPASHPLILSSHPWRLHAVPHTPYRG